MLANIGGRRFADASAVTGFHFDDDGRGLATLDMDGDGDLDVVTSNRTAPRLRILRNDVGHLGRSISVLAEGDGRICNRDGIGARLEVILAGDRPPLVRTVRAGEGYLSQSTRWQVFGLATADRIEGIVVHWPGGRITRHPVPQEQSRLIVRPDGSSEIPPQPQVEALTVGPIDVAPSEPASRCLVIPRWPAPRRLTPEGPEPAGPSLLILWSRECETCTASRDEVEQSRGALKAAGLTVVEQVAEDLDREGKLRFQAINDALLEDHGPLPVPYAILLDANQKIAALYRGPLDLDEIRRDAEHVSLSLAERHHAGVPYPGRWIEAPPATDLRRAGDTLQRAGLVDDAEEFYALDLERGATPRTLYNRAGVLRRMGRIDEAMAAFQQALDLDGAFVSAYAGLAMCHYDRGRLEAAQKNLEHAVALDARFAEGWYDLGLVLARRARFEAARAALRKSLDLNPGLTDAWLWLAHVHENTGKLQEAAKALRTARRERGSTRDLLATARFRMRRGRHERAAQLLEAGLRENPDDAELRFDLGFLRTERRQDAAAARELNRALSLDPNRAAGHHALGVLHARNGRLVEAMRAFERTLALDAGHEEARRLLERTRRMVASKPKEENDD